MMGTHGTAAGFCSMRAMIFPLLMLLAACGEREEDRQPGVSTNIVERDAGADNLSRDGNAGDPTEPEEAGTSNAAEPSPVTSAMPSAVQGRWTGLNDACGDRTADLELNITRDSLIFHESVGKVTGVASRPNGHVSVDAAFTGEGESWTRTLELRPSANGRELTIINDGVAVTRKRC